MPFEQFGQGFFIPLPKTVPEDIIRKGKQSLVLVIKNNRSALLQTELFLHLCNTTYVNASTRPIHRRRAAPAG
jgi:hypothetical protein